MPIQQTMSGKSAQKMIDASAQKFATLIVNEEWTIEFAHSVLLAPDKHGLDLFNIAGLAKAIACFQCVAEEVH